MERQNLPVAHRLSRRTQGTVSGTHVGTQSDANFAKGCSRNVETKQASTRIHRTAIEDLHGRKTPSYSATVTRSYAHPFGVKETTRGQIWSHLLCTPKIISSWIAQSKRSQRKVGGTQVNSPFKKKYRTYIADIF